LADLEKVLSEMNDLNAIRCVYVDRCSA
jgi:hypothetical protein